MKGIIPREAPDVNVKKRARRAILESHTCGAEAAHQEGKAMGRPVIGIVGNLLIEQAGFSPGMENHAKPCKQ